METLSLTVTGMTCQHCVASVTKEVSQVAGVQSVAVALDEGAVTVTGSALSAEAIVSAIAEAGYTASI
jgi:copper ion binding protein